MASIQLPSSPGAARPESRTSSLPSFLLGELLLEIAVEPQPDFAAQFHGAVFAEDPVRQARVVRQRADQEDRPLARVIGRQQERVGNVAAVLLDVEARRTR